MPASVLARLLLATTPAGTPALFAAFPWRPRVHLALVVHRVEGLAPGAYLFARDEAAAPDVRTALAGGDATWQRVEVAGVRLVRLRAGDRRDAARLASCDQPIAADGALCAILLADVEPVLRAEGAWAYRRLHWEAGLVAHALYLEGGAVGLGASAIGCFLDGESRRLAGGGGPEPRPLYHVALGAPIADARLRTDAPYRHRAGRGG